MKKKIFATIVLLFSAFVYVIYNHYKHQDYIVFKSEPLERNYVFTWNYPFEEVFLPLKNGAEIHGLFFKRPNSKGVILFCHGRSRNLTYHGRRAGFFLDRGYDVFIFDYRGFGKSSRGFKEEWLLEDGDTAYEFLKKSYPEKNIIVYGQSLGTAVGTWVAAHHYPKMLILEAPFYSLISVAAYAKPYIPEWILRRMLKYQFHTNEWIQNVSVPIYIFHGTKDTVVPIDQAKRLFAEIRDRKKVEMIILPEWEHEDLPKHEICKKKLSQLLN